MNLQESLYSIATREPALAPIFVASVVLAAYWGGWRAGILATVLGAIGASFDVLRPTAALLVGADRSAWLALSILAISGGMISFGMDMLRRGKRRAETTQAQMSDLLARAADLAEMAIFERNVKTGAIEHGAYGARVLLGLRPGESLELSHLIERVHPADQDRLAAQLKAAFEPEAAVEFHSEFRIVRPDGSVRWMRIRSQTSFHQVAGRRRPLRSIVSMVDITEALAREQALHNALSALEMEKQRVEAILQLNTDGWWDWDILHPEEEYLSSGFKKLFGYDDHELPNKTSSWKRLIHPDDLEVALDNFAKHLSSDGAHPYWQEVRYRHKDGHTVWVICKGKAVKDESGRFTRMIGVHTDITKQKLLQLELERTNRNLERHVADLVRANTELEQFSYIAAHDLRAPLQLIINWIQLLDHLLPQPRPAELIEVIESISRSASKAVQLVNDMLEIARLKVSTPEKAVDLNTIVRDVMDELALEIERTNASVRCDTLPSVAGVTMHLECTFRNLIQNALIYRDTTRPPKIHIGCLETEDFYQIFVQDNGIGIEPQYYDRIFEMFARVRADQGRTSSTGIGLAICKKAVELDGGRIWIRSTPGEGSTFFFSLPKFRQEKP